MLLRCILEIILLSLQLRTAGFISVNKIGSVLGKCLKRKRKMIEGLKKIAHRWVKQEWFYQTSV